MEIIRGSSPPGGVELLVFVLARAVPAVVKTILVSQLAGFEPTACVRAMVSLFAFFCIQQYPLVERVF